MAIGSTTSEPVFNEFIGPECLPDYDKLVTEDDKPVDSIYSERQHQLLTSRLIDSWKGPGEGGPFWISTDVALFYGSSEPAFSPDVLLSLGVSPPRGDPKRKENHSYYMWKYLKPPDAIIEVVSNTAGGELTTKLKGYARIGAIYYVVWDPFLYLGDKKLNCFALERGKYVPCECWFPELELGVKVWDGVYADIQATYLRWCDQQGKLIPTGAERADQEKQRADEEKHRADKLAEKLRALGIDPDQP